MTGSLAAAAAVMTLTIANPPLLTLHYTVLTESLFVSIFAVFLGLLMRLSRRPSLRLTAAVSLVAGVAVTVRPAGWFLCPLMLIVALMLGKNFKQGASRLMLLACAIIPLLTVTGIERAFSIYRQDAGAHDAAMPSLLDRALIGKAGMIDAPADAIDRSTSARVLESDFTPVRSLVAHAPNWGVRRYLEISYETCLEYACAAALGLEKDFRNARRAALARISANPGGFFSLAWQQYLSLWSIYAVANAREASIDNAYIEAHRPLPMEGPVHSQMTKLKPAKWTTKLVQLALWLIAAATGILSLAGLIAAVTRFSPPPVPFTAMSSSLSVQGGLALAAVFGVGITRYMLVFWPAMVVAMVFGVWTLLAQTHSPKGNPHRVQGRGYRHCRYQSSGITRHAG